jgi:TolB protein
MLALMLCAAIGMGDEPAYSADGRAILFIEGSPSNLYKMRADGTDVVRLTNTRRHEESPLYSPDGRFIVFSAAVDQISEIYLMNADGGGERQLTHDHAFAIHPSWAPDGKRVIYSTTRDSKDPAFDKADNWQTYSINVDGSGARRLPLDGPVNTYASYSPDGKHLLYRKKSSTTSKISDIYLDSTNLTHGVAYDRYPSFSPDAKSIVFESNRSGHSQILMMNADGSGVRVVTDGPGQLSAPRFSPDGTRVVFVSDEKRILRVDVSP